MHRVSSHYRILKNCIGLSHLHAGAQVNVGSVSQTNTSPSCTPLQTTWTLEQYQLHNGTCNGCENSESVIACNYAACSGSPHLCILGDCQSPYLQLLKMQIISRKNPSHPPALKLGSSALDRVYSYKYLGLLLTLSLCWTEHINDI